MKVRCIPSIHKRRKKRVAAYCRVSTDKTEQEDSFDAQVRYYRDLIMQNAEWELADIYADAGQSATGVKRRPEFLRMIADAMEGKIDLILTKSISRFSRNVVDCQQYVNQLRAKGVEVRFEREHLYTLDASVDMIFSMMAAIAQDESRSISENVKWSCQQRGARGVRRLGNNRVLGYDEVNGQLVPNGNAWIIQKAFQLFLEKNTCAQIAREITAAGGRRLRGSTPMDGTYIRRILSNEIYVGDRLIQKNAPVHYLTKKPDINAQYQSWYWKDTHKGIVDRPTWDAAQVILDVRRREVAAGVQKKGKNTHFLYGKVFCGLCGKPMTRYTLKAGSKRSQGEAIRQYCKAWNCRDHIRKPRCNNCNIHEDVLLKAISDALNWKWRGQEAFESERFLREVAIVYVTKGAVKVQRIARRMN